MEIKYFDSNILLPDAEITYENGLQNGYYNKVFFENNLPIYSEYYRNNKIINVVYFNRNPEDTNLIQDHFLKYEKIKFHICNHWIEEDIFVQKLYYFSEEGKQVSSCLLKGRNNWNWDEEEMFGPNGEKWETIKYIYDTNGELIKEQHFKPDGTLWFEYDEDDLL